MDISDQLIIKPQGKVNIKIWDITTPDFIVNTFNAILENSKVIIAKTIGGNINFSINQIKVYSGGILLATAIPVISFPISNKTEFFAEFDTTSFTGTVDELRLCSSVGGDFSQITGISITKNNIQNMSVKWSIEII